MVTTGDGFDLLAYGDTLEKSLAKRRAASDGAARKLLVEAVLAPFLPPTIAMGPGVILDGGARTPAIDLLLCRASFPRLHEGKTSLVLLEGALAAITIHRKLGPRELRAAWELTAAVRELSPIVHAPRRTPKKSGGKRHILDELMSEATLSARKELSSPPGSPPEEEPPSERVRSYVLALDAVPEATLGRAILENATRLGPDGAPDCLWVRGRTIAFRAGDDTMPARVEGEPGTYALGDASPLGWLYAHLWRGVICRRAGTPPLAPYIGGRR